MEHPKALTVTAAQKQRISTRAFLKDKPVGLLDLRPDPLSRVGMHVGWPRWLSAETPCLFVAGAAGAGA